MNDTTKARIIAAALRNYEADLEASYEDPELTPTEKRWYGTELDLVQELLGGE